MVGCVGVRRKEQLLIDMAEEARQSFSHNLARGNNSFNQSQASRDDEKWRNSRNIRKQ